MKKISIRLRLTLVMTALLSLLCVALTILTQWHSNTMIVEPVQLNLKMMSLQEPARASQPAQTLTPAAGTEEPDPYSVPAAAAVLTEGAENFTAKLWLTMAAVVALGAVLTYGVSSLALRPIQELTRRVVAVDEQQLSCDLSDFQAGDEVSRLADSFGGLLERLRAAFERERRFSAYAAHEMKTPLAVVKTALDVMDEEDLHDPEACRETLHTIQKQNDRMIDLTGQLLLLSSVQQQQTTSEVALAPLIGEILDELAPLAQERQVTLHADLQEVSLPAHPVMLKQAISNVVENAIRYNHPQGWVQVRLRPGELLVEDDGSGVPQEERAHIFEPFYRVDKSRSRRAGGTGLGLAITREVLAQSGAAICCEPNSPQGSRFRITFSCERNPPESLPGQP